jgi:outer membrane beta-barrel protein
MLKLALLALVTALMMTNKVHAGEKSLYDFLWLDPDKKVYVLQNKLYKKELTAYIDLGYISNFTSKFQDTYGFTGRVGYYVHEEWAFEGFYNGYQNRNNDDFRNVRLINRQEPFIRRLNNSYGLNLIWSPFYGKINTFNQIFYFDWSFGAGLAKVNGESNRKSVKQGDVITYYTKESYNGAVLKTNMKFHVSEHWHLGVEYMNTYFMAPGPRSSQPKLRTNTDVILTVGYSF